MVPFDTKYLLKLLHKLHISTIGMVLSHFQELSWQHFHHFVRN